MSDDLQTILALLLAAGVIWMVLGRTVLAMATTPPADIARIKANLGGVAGLAGVGKEVVSVTRAGTIFPTRSSPPGRRYLVTLRDADGNIERRFVEIDLGLFGDGGMTVQSPHYRAGATLTDITDGKT